METLPGGTESDRTAFSEESAEKQVKEFSNRREHEPQKMNLAWWLPNCPACGYNGVENTEKFLIECQKCGMVLKGEGWGYTMKHGPPELANKSYSGWGWRKIAKQQQEDQDNPGIDRQQINEWNPKYPILSVFAATMLIWGGFFSLSQSGSPIFDFVLFTSLGVLITPRVRRIVAGTIRERTQRNPTGRISRIVIGCVYSLLVAIVALLIIGEAANDPNLAAGDGVGAIIVAFVVAVVIVYSIRAYRRFSGS